MPRNRLTAEQVAHRGADKVNPGRFRDRLAAPKHEAPIGNPPEHLSGEAQACWFEFVAYSIPGTLTAADRVMLESASNLLAEYRTAPVEFTAAKLGMLFKALASFGMTPVDRQKLGAAKKADENPFDALDS